MLKTTKSVLSDTKWMGFSAEESIILAIIYFFCCYFMSNYSRKLEKELDTGL
jgi:general L-amino acid transport system permease protein